MEPAGEKTPPAEQQQEPQALPTSQPMVATGSSETEGSSPERTRRVQWSEVEKHDAASVKEKEEEPQVDRKVLEDLRRSLFSASGQPVPHGGGTLPSDPTRAAEDHGVLDNFAGADSEFMIPSGETEGLPSLAARRRATKSSADNIVSRKFRSFFGSKKKKEGQMAKEGTDVEAQGDDVSDEEDLTQEDRTVNQPTSVLGSLLALKEADNSSASTPSASVLSLPLSDAESNWETDGEGQGKSGAGSGAATPHLPEGDVGDATLRPTTPGSTTTTLVPESGGSSAVSMRSGKSGLHPKGHPAFLKHGANAISSAAHSAVSTPGSIAKVVGRQLGSDKKKKEDAAERKRRKREKKKQEIVLHLAALIERQEFIMKLTRALIMFGSPSHRLEQLIQNTGNYLEAPVQCVFTPGVMTLSFSDPGTRTSDTKFIKQGSGLDLDRLPKTHTVYRKVLHGKMTVTEASAELDSIMLSKPTWNAFCTIIIGMFCSAWITPLAFGGSFVDALAAAILGGLLVTVQMIVAKKESYSNIFEILVSAINSFIAAALGYSGVFCYSAVVAGSVVLILPGFIILCGSLELTSRNISAGSVRMFYAIIYALFLGFGISLGYLFWFLITGKSVYDSNTQDCTAVSPLNDPSVPWWKRAAPVKYYILFAPMFQLFLALRNQTRLTSRTLFVMVFIGSAGYTVNYFVSHNSRFGGRADISSAFGAFTVGLLGNLWGRLTSDSGFVVMTPGILFQLPSGFGQGGLLAFASTNSSRDVQYNAGQDLGQSLIAIANGLTVGLFFSSALINPSSRNKRKQAHLFSF